MLVAFFVVETPLLTSAIRLLNLDSLRLILVLAVVPLALRVTAGLPSSSLESARSLFSLGRNSYSLPKSPAGSGVVVVLAARGGLPGDFFCTCFFLGDLVLVAPSSSLERTNEAVARLVRAGEVRRLLFLSCRY